MLDVTPGFTTTTKNGLAYGHLRENGHSTDRDLARDSGLRNPDTGARHGDIPESGRIGTTENLYYSIAFKKEVLLFRGKVRHVMLISARCGSP